MNRNDRILRAIATSLLSKGSTFVIQVLALPLVARKLGQEQLGLYAALSAVPAWFSTADLGIGPALTHKIARGVAGNDEGLQARYFFNALIVLLIVGITIAVTGALIVLTGKTARVFGTTFEKYDATLSRGFALVITIVAVQIVTSLGAKARAGFQETHVNNLFAAGENAAKVGLLVLLAWFGPSVLLVLLVVFGCGLLANLANIGSLLGRRPYLVKPQGLAFRATAKELLSDGLLYAVAIGLLSVQREVGRLLLARGAGIEEVGRYSILTAMITMMFGFVVMATTPIWPAMADAVARRDEVWLQKLRSKLMGLSWLYGVLCGAVVALGGRAFVDALYGPSYTISRTAFALLGGYFLIIVLGHVRFVWLMGHDKTRLLAFISALECVVTVAILVSVRARLSIESVLLILMSTHALCSVLIQGWLSRRYVAPALTIR